MIFQQVMSIGLWVGLSGIVYSYAVYPAVIFAAARLFGRRPVPPVAGDPGLPSVTLLIAAHNEQDSIRDRLDNALAMAYPPGKLRVVVASDGSVDQTAAIVRDFADRGVVLIENAARSGKSSTLNNAIAGITDEIVILSDANTATDAAAARSLCRWFIDPAVGVVCGRLEIVDPVSGKNVDGLYWKYETFLKKQESRLGALLGSNGAIYAIRRSLFPPVPPQTIVDDFVIPLLAKSRSGCSIIYDTEATAREESAPDVGSEFRRRCRIGAGGWQAVFLLWPLLNPRRGWIAFTFFSHKVLRWVCPFLMLLVLVCNLALVGVPLFRSVLVAQLAFYLLAAIGAVIPRGMPGIKLLKLANMFVAMNAALLVGFFRWALVRQTGVWSRTPREPGPSALPGPAPGESRARGVLPK
jgi:cellulose synthase/poly-beta-1,6-N-acetylglucosamine synthase-like glycosyltransferase